MKTSRGARKKSLSSSKAAPEPAAAPPPHRPSPLDAVSEKLDGWIVLALALAVRLVYVAVASVTNPAFDVVLKGFDQNTYQNQADMILKGDILLRQVGLFYYSPVYAYFCALIYKVVGHPSFLALHLAQAAVSALTCLICFRLARTWLGRSAALLAALFFILLAPWLFYEQELLHEGLMLLFYAVLLWGLRTAQAGGRRVAWRLALAGACGVLALIGRGNAALVLLALVPWVALAVPRPASAPGARTGRGRFNARAALALCCGIALVFGPLLLRNRAVSGHWALGMGNGKVLFYIGNNAQSEGDFTYPPRFLEAQKKAGSDPGVYMRQFREDLASDPGHILFNLLRKTYFFLGARDLPDNLNFHLGRQLIPLVGYSPVQWEWLVPLGLVGLGLTLRRRRQWSLLWLFAAVFAASLILIIPIGRYRQPILIPLVIWAAFAVEWAAGCWRARRFGPLVAALGAFALLGMALWGGEGPFIRTNDYMAAASMSLKSKRLAQAEQIIHDGMQTYPTLPQLAQLAFSLAQAKGDQAEMSRLGELLLQNPPISPDVGLGMANLDIDRKNFSRAQMILNSLERMPDLSKDPELQGQIMQAVARLRTAQAQPPAAPGR